MSKLSDISKAISGLISLDAFVEAELAALEQQYGNSAREAGEAVLEKLAPDNGLPEVATERELEQQLAEQGMAPARVKQSIAALLIAGLLSRTSSGGLRLGSNVLAGVLAERFRGQRSLRREMEGLIREKQQRAELLSEKELNRVAPVLPSLNLTEEEREFVSRSERAVKRRRWALWGAVIALILLLSWLSWNWYYESVEAQQARDIAERKTEEALDSAAVAQQLRLEAEKLAASLSVERDSSEARRIRAELSEKEAQLQALLARQAARRAKEQEAIALLLADTLRMQLDTVRKYRALAEAGRQAAVDSAAAAESARERAEALALILKSRNIALSVPQLPEDSVERKAVLAYQAYAVNRDSRLGNVYNSDVYKALNHALRVLWEKRGFSNPNIRPTLHREAVTSIVRGPRGSEGEQYFSAGTDGNVRIWGGLNQQGGKPNSMDIWLGLADFTGEHLEKDSSYKNFFPEIVQAMAGSPDGRWLLICPRLDRVALLDNQKGLRYEAKYPSRWGATGALFLPEERAFLIVGHAGNVLKLRVDEPTAEPMRQFKEDQPFLAIARNGNTLYLLDQQGHLRAGPLNGLPTSVNGLQHRGSGYTIFAVKDGFLACGERTGAVVLSLEEPSAGPDRAAYANQWHQAAVTAMQFSPGARWLASISRDGVLRITDVPRFFRESSTYQPILLDMKDVHATAACFSADSKELLVGTKDGSIHRFYLEPEEYARKLCQLLNLEGDDVDWRTPWQKDFQEKSAPKTCY